MALVPPLPHAILDLPMEDGSHIRLRRHGNLAGHRLLVSHGNGFAADAYLPFWAPLLRDYELVAFDGRNHGQNLPSDPARHTYGQMARDLDRVLDGVALAWGRRKSAGIFHSMSARVAMKHAIDTGWRWDALALFDPPNFPPAGHAFYVAPCATSRTGSRIGRATGARASPIRRSLPPNTAPRAAPPTGSRASTI